MSAKFDFTVNLEKQASNKNKPRDARWCEVANCRSAATAATHSPALSTANAHWTGSQRIYSYWNTGFGRKQRITGMCKMCYELAHRKEYGGITPFNSKEDFHADG